VIEKLEVSERRTCRALEFPRSSQRYEKRVREDEPRLVEDMIGVATQYGRYGYRRVLELLRWKGWWVNHKRVERLWKREGLKIPRKQPKRRRLWLNDGSCVRLRPERPNHVWSYDFVHARTSDGRGLKFLTIIDEYTRECLAIDVGRRMTSEDVLCRLAELFIRRNVPAHIRSDNGPEFTAKVVRLWLEALDVKTLFIEPGSPWENGYCESFNGKFRDEFLNREILDTVLEARVLTARWRRYYNEERPHSALSYRPPAPEAIMPMPVEPAVAAQRAPAPRGGVLGGLLSGAESL
jgi:transposase InsO family protein